MVMIPKKGKARLSLADEQNSVVNTARVQANMDLMAMKLAQKAAETSYKVHQK